MVVGITLEATGVVEVGTSLPDGVGESDAVVVGTTEDSEVEVGKIEPITEDKNPGSVVELVGAVEAPVPVNEIPEETDVTLSVLDTLVTEDTPVPEKLTPDAELDGDTLVRDEVGGSVDVDDTTPPGPKVIAEETLEAEVAVEETTSVAESVGEAELEGVGETTTEGALPLEATVVSDLATVESVEDSVDATEDEVVSTEDVDEAVGEITLSGMPPVVATELEVVVAGVAVESGETRVVSETTTVVTPSTLDVDDDEPVPNIDPKNPVSELVPVVPACVPIEVEESEEVASELVPVIDCKKSESELEVDRLVVDELDDEEPSDSEEVVLAGTVVKVEFAKT